MPHDLAILKPTPETLKILKGLEELGQTGVTERTKRLAALEGGNLIRRAAVNLAPMGKFSKDPGALKRSLVSKNPVSRGARKKSHAFVAIHYGIAKHAHLVEFGTGIRRPKSKKGMAIPAYGIFGGSVVLKGEHGGKWGYLKKEVKPMPKDPFFFRAATSQSWGAKKLMSARILKALRRKGKKFGIKIT